MRGSDLTILRLSWFNLPRWKFGAALVNFQLMSDCRQLAFVVMARPIWGDRGKIRGLAGREDFDNERLAAAPLSSSSKHSDAKTRSIALQSEMDDLIRREGLSWQCYLEAEET